MPVSLLQHHAKGSCQASTCCYSSGIRHVHHQRGDELGVSDAQGEGGGPGLVRHHPLRAVAAGAGLGRGVSGGAVAAQHGEGRLLAQVDVGVRAVVAAGARRLGRLVGAARPARHGEAGARGFGGHVRAHDGREGVLVGGWDRVQGAVQRARPDGVGGRPPLGAAGKGFLRAVRSRAWSTENSHCGEVRRISGHNTAVKKRDIPKYS